MTSWDYKVIVVGGGHAGVEAAYVAGKMGERTALVTIDPTKLALMSCNPAIGGVGKSHVVKEIDALGGIMAEAIDATGIQFRRLNLSRGPAVWSTRAQADRIGYNNYIVKAMEQVPNVDVIAGTAGEILVEQGKVVGIRTETGETITGPTVIICSGTFLGGLIHIGEKKIPSGRMGESAAYKLSDSLRELGFDVGRLKTGTPPRLDGKTIDWSVCTIQPGEEPIPFFSHRSFREAFEQTPCHLTSTTSATKAIIAENYKRSPIFSGEIHSIGPRYCPSIEDKYFRFADKETHHIFLEPEGNGTDEIYPNGFSTGLPQEIQEKAIRTVIGCENVIMTQPGYAIEYDYCPAYQIKPTLETKRIKGLFFAGQINGTSGYEEAGGQGLIAGINAVQYLHDGEYFVPGRSESYIGVMIDDLTTRSTSEPYRLFTSRAEYRLSLREDNARDRMNKYAKQYDLLPDAEMDAFDRLRTQTIKTIKELGKTRITVDSLGELGERFVRKDNISLEDLLKQPNISTDDAIRYILSLDSMFTDKVEALRRAAVHIRYSGYIDRQEKEIERNQRLESETIPEEFSYNGIKGLKTEALEKFIHFKPSSLGQAGRIEGVTPGDIAVLQVYLKRFKESRLLNDVK